jgi:hypothetical protein
MEEKMEFIKTQYIAAIGSYKTKAPRLMNRVGPCASHFWAGFEGTPQPEYTGDKYEKQFQAAHYAAGKHCGGVQA